MRRLAVVALLFGAAGCATPVVGLQPVAPAVERAWYKSTPSFTEVDGVTPELRWQAFDSVPGASEATYELRIWERRSGDSGPLVYRRTELAEPHHRVEEPLFPRTRYLWSVRAHFTLDGERRVSPWGRYGIALSGDTVPDSACFRFRTPAPESGPKLDP